MGEAIVLDMAAAVPLTTNSVTNSLTELSILIINNENKSLKHLCSKIHKKKQVSYNKMESKSTI